MVYCNSCFECLRSAWRTVLDIRRRDPPTDPECLLWYERTKISRLDLLVPVLQAFFVFLDVGLDLKVAAIHWENGDCYWALYTIIIVVITQIFLQLVSAFWFVEDSRDKTTEKQTALQENDLRVKPWMLASHVFLLGRFVRFYQTWRLLRKIRSEAENTSLENDERARQQFIRRQLLLYLGQTLDSNTLALIEAFLEGAPQVALQLHILFQTSHVDLTSPGNVVVAATILKSLLLFAFSHLSYVRYTRKVNEPAAQLELLSAGAAALYLWRLLMLVSRVLILALFSSTFPPYTFVLVALRFVVFLGIVLKQECNYFEDSSKKQCLFKVAVAYIHIFSFFPLISERTQSLGIIYYFSTFVENCTVLMLWVSYSSWDSVCRIVAVLAVNVSFAFGLSFLALYYRCFHPRIVEAHKTKSELVARTVVDSSGVIHLCVVSAV